MNRTLIGTRRPALPLGRVELPLLLSVFLALAVVWPSGCAELHTAQAAPVPAGAPGPVAGVLTLPECIQLAQERQPALAAYRTDLALAESGARYLDNLRVPTLIDKELPYRRRQAALGVTAAAGGLDQAEKETVYAVTRNYQGVLYAREQERVARRVVDRLRTTNATAQRLLNAGARNMTESDVDRSAVYTHLAEVRLVQAQEGADRALAALKEAMGLGPDCCIDVPAGSLPEPHVQLCKSDLVARALDRRGDLAQAVAFAEIVCVEVDAQGATIHLRVPTFAAFSDIHARPIATGSTGTEYRPGALPPEMPTTLAGSRPERMDRARTLSARAAAVVEKTRGLVTLDVEDAFVRWQKAVERAGHAQKAAVTGDKLAEGLSRDFTSGQSVKVDEVVNAHVLASQARASYNEALYQQILALADLERATGGAFCAGFLTPLAPAAPAAQGQTGSEPSLNGNNK